MDASIGGIVLAIAVIRFTNCQACCDFKMSSTSPPSESKLMDEHNGVPNVLECARFCTGIWPCAFTQYCEKDRTCALYAKCANCTTGFVSCSNGKAPITVSYSQPSRSTISPAPTVCDVNKYLVTGPDGIADNQLSASSFFCSNRVTLCGGVADGLSAKYARLNSTGGPTGSWSPILAQATDHIQVDFLTTRLTTGVVLTGRNIHPDFAQYVTAFKVLHSLDCISFSYVRNENGIVKTFVGPSYLKEVVIRCFKQPIPARCIRINPILWVGYPSLRFDVLGY